MHYKEYEFIDFCTYWGIDKKQEKAKLWIIPILDEKCWVHDITSEEIDKIWHPLMEKQKIVRKQRLKKFKKLKPSDFANMPIRQKLQYIDAFKETQHSTEEWTEYFCKNGENLKALLFSIQPSKKFLLEEQRDLNHFMNTLIGSGLDKTIRESDKRDFEQRKQDMQDFVYLFCKVYEVAVPKLLFEKLDNRNGDCNLNIEMSNDYKSKEYKFTVRINEEIIQNPNADCLKNFGILFHELMHERQLYWLFYSDEKYYPFAKACNSFETLTSNQDLNYEIYKLQPKEGHAFYMQRKFEEQCNERIFGSKINQAVLDAPTARTLWYDYQK